MWTLVVLQKPRAWQRIGGEQAVMGNLHNVLGRQAIYMCRATKLSLVIGGWSFACRHEPTSPSPKPSRGWRGPLASSAGRVHCTPQGAAAQSPTAAACAARLIQPTAPVPVGKAGWAVSATHAARDASSASRTGGVRRTSIMRRGQGRETDVAQVAKSPILR